MGHTKQNLHIMIVWNNLTPPPHTHMHLYNTHTATWQYIKKKKNVKKEEVAARGVYSTQC
jgi:hypothetical protein